MRVRGQRGRWLAVVAVGCVAAVAPVAVGVNAVGALVGFAVDVADSSNDTITTSTKHVATSKRVDLEDAPAPECDFPGTEATPVNQTSTDLEPVVTLRDTIGPNDILVGENESVPFHVEAGTTNLDILSTYETVVTQYFQATAAGESCALFAAVRFTG